MIDDKLYWLMIRDRNRIFVAHDKQGREYDCFVPRNGEDNVAFVHPINHSEPSQTPSENYQQ